MDDGSPPIDEKKSKPSLTIVEGGRFEAKDSDFDGANDEARAIKLAAYEEEHRDLDAAILAMEQSTPYERLAIARLKKKKLSLKDKIQNIKDSMLPDIIA